MNILEQLEAGVQTHSAEETIALAEALAAVLPEEAIIALSGDLGAGKTTFVKGLGRAFAVEATVTSPTYNIFTLHSGKRQLAHMDAYRLEGADSVDALMLEEFLRAPFCLVVEWPEKILEWFPPETLFLRFEARSESERLIRRAPRP